MQSGGAAAQPRLAQAEVGWVFPKADQCVHPSLQTTPALCAAPGTAAQPTDASLLGTNTCGDYIMDGPLGDIPRGQ